MAEECKAPRSSELPRTLQVCKSSTRNQARQKKSRALFLCWVNFRPIIAQLLTKATAARRGFGTFACANHSRYFTRFSASLKLKSQSSRNKLLQQKYWMKSQAPCLRKGSSLRTVPMIVGIHIFTLSIKLNTHRSNGSIQPK